MQIAVLRSGCIVQRNGQFPVGWRRQFFDPYEMSIGIDTRVLLARQPPKDPTSVNRHLRYGKPLIPTPPVRAALERGLCVPYDGVYWRP